MLAAPFGGFTTIPAMAVLPSISQSSAPLVSFVNEMSPPAAAFPLACTEISTVRAIKEELSNRTSCRAWVYCKTVALPRSSRCAVPLPRTEMEAGSCDWSTTSQSLAELTMRTTKSCRTRSVSLANRASVSAILTGDP